MKFSESMRNPFRSLHDDIVMDDVPELHATPHAPLLTIEDGRIKINNVELLIDSRRVSIECLPDGTVRIRALLRRHGA